jgi:hypothetical protein
MHDFSNLLNTFTYKLEYLMLISLLDLKGKQGGLSII